jgi:hypothetical protein
MSSPYCYRARLSHELSSPPAPRHPRGLQNRGNSSTVKALRFLRTYSSFCASRTFYRGPYRGYSSSRVSRRLWKIGFLTKRTHRRCASPGCYRRIRVVSRRIRIRSCSFIHISCRPFNCNFILLFTLRCLFFSLFHQRVLV